MSHRTPRRFVLPQVGAEVDAGKGHWTGPTGSALPASLSRPLPPASLPGGGHRDGDHAHQTLARRVSERDSSAGSSVLLIDEVDASLKAWAQNVAGQAEVSLGQPSSRPGTGVNLYLLGMQGKPALRGGQGPPPVQVGLRYLVTTWSDAAEQAHRLLGELVLAAIADPDLDVDLEGLPPNAWAAFQLPPQPAFVIIAVLRQARTTPPAKLVRELSLKWSQMTPLAGTVLGPTDTALADATVELPALGLTTETDWRGQFRFASVPPAPAVKQLVVRARGRDLAVAVTETGEPLTIRFTPLEG